MASGPVDSLGLSGDRFRVNADEKSIREDNGRFPGILRRPVDRQPLVLSLSACECRVMARTTRGRGRGGRGRGRGLVEEPVLSEAQNSARGPVSGQQTLHDGQTASVTASVGAGVGPVGAGVGSVGAGFGPVEAGGVGAAGAAVAAAGVAQAGDDRLTDLLRQLLERLPGAVPRIGTGSFAGGVKPEEADEWRMEQNFR
ncbi:hypothetical protein AALP_AAs69130U000100 [Arabis alpina]|uniref:Uncharacterized protein n=1 Tax=Arabis alpina TaxID=50452 RepID=A0A087FX38_ARAAL|nr:hypothetical protein AALP_AAs69130U000100 [Arabis alpina]